MSCSHPLILINTSNMLDPKQREIVERLKMRKKLTHDKRIRSVNTIIVPRELAEREGLTLEKNNAVLIPCGRCIGCRLDYSRMWAERCIHEASKYKDNYFLTLTYDDEHLPIGSKGVPTLLNDEISKFMKLLRQKLKRDYDFEGVRFLASAEYGSEGRPHYHILLFNCPLPDLTDRHPVKVDGKIKKIHIFDKSTGSIPLLYSPLIGEIWNKGTSPLGVVNFQTCAYVSRYIMKKQFGDDAVYYQQCGIIPPFLRMSRNPGIGFDWYDAHYDKILEDGHILLNRGDKVVRMNPAKYFYKLVLERDPEVYYRLKANHKNDLYDSIYSMACSGVEFVKHNKNAEDALKHSAKLLKREV